MSDTPSDPPDHMPEGVTLREPTDFKTLRQNVFDTVREEFGKSFPVQYGGVRIELEDLKYRNERDYDPDEQVEALFHNQHPSRTLVGKLKLFDEESGQQIDEKELSLMRVPWLTDRGTIMHNGSDYTVAMQSRLLPGAYARIQENGESEVHFNTKMGTGAALRVGFLPDKAEYRLRVSSKGSVSDAHLYSLLHDMGVPDETLAEQWGEEILERNRSKYDPRTLDRVYGKVVLPHMQNPEAERDEKVQKIREALNKSLVHKKVLSRTLPGYFDKNWRERIAALAVQKQASADEAEKGPDFLSTYFKLRKHAAFTKSDLQALAALLNREIGAGVAETGTRAELEASIMAFIQQDQAPTGADAIGAPIGNQQALRELGATLERQNSPTQLLKGAAFDNLTLPEDPVLERLNRAKHESDAKRYAAKHAILSGLLQERPEEFSVDSREGKFWGITHEPTKFRIHVPSQYVPASVATRASGDMVKEALPLKERLLKARADTEQNPTEAQLKAENYRKGKYRWNGFTIALENPKGSTRTGRSRDGKEWSCLMRDDYGYFLQTTGRDKDHLDVFIGPELESDLVVVVNQQGPDGRFDEHKVIIGARSERHARLIYLRNYEPGWKGLGSSIPMTLDKFRAWLSHGDQSKPAKAL